MVVYGCVLPFNNIESALLLERNYFMTSPSDCQLTNTSQCEDSTSNPPLSVCPSSKWYQPPIPLNITLDGTYYDPMETSDIDCTDEFWSDGCADEYCNRYPPLQCCGGLEVI